MVRKSLFKKMTFEQGPEKGLDLIALVSGELHSRQQAMQRPWDRRSLRGQNNSGEARVPGAKPRLQWQKSEIIMQTYDCRGEGWGEGIVKEFGTDM